jgi:hypothetical protein
MIMDREGRGVVAGGEPGRGGRNDPQGSGLKSRELFAIGFVR